MLANHLVFDRLELRRCFTRRFAGWVAGRALAPPLGDGFGGIDHFRIDEDRCVRQALCDLTSQPVGTTRRVHVGYEATRFESKRAEDRIVPAIVLPVPGPDPREARACDCTRCVTTDVVDVILAMYPRKRRQSLERLAYWRLQP